MALDESLFFAINGLAGRSVILDWIALTLSAPGTLYLPGILLGGYWIRLNRREASVGLLTLGGLITLVDFLGARLKDLIARPRPCMSLADVHQFGACGKTFGFPSNHALNTAAAAAFFQVLYPKSGWVSWPIVFLVGFSRVYVGAHYVSDVLGSWLIGGLLGGGCAWLLLQWPKFRQRTWPTSATQASNSAR